MRRERRVLDADAVPVETYLPNVQNAEVAESKIVDYLLSTTHPEGKDKANFFLSFGFSSERWQEFADALTRHAATHEVESSVETGYGVCYLVDGAIESPDQRNPQIRAVWQIDLDAVNPRLITAYPL